MRKLLAILVVLVLAVPVFGKEDAVKKARVKKTQPAKKVKVVHPVKPSATRMIKNQTSTDGELNSLRLQDTIQKKEQAENALLNVQNKNSETQGSIINNLK
jgi:hypothetical protein